MDLEDWRAPFGAGGAQVGENGSLDRAGFRQALQLTVLGDDQIPARPLGVLTVCLLDAVDGADVHAGALPFADVLHDFAGSSSSSLAAPFGRSGR
jgi:hypothetical protein